MKSIATIMLILISGSTAAVDLDSLLRQSVGGAEAVETIRELRTVRATGRVVLNGEPGRFRQLYRAPDKYYLEVVFGNFSLVQGFDGQTAWQRDFNGGLSELDGFARREVLRTIYFESYAYLLDEDRDNKRTYLGELEIDGSRYHRVAFFPFASDTLVCLFDASSGRRSIMFDRVDQLQTVTTVDDYRNVSGLLVPFHTSVVAEEASFVTEFQADTILINVEIPDSAFTMPTASVEDYHFPDNAEKVEIACEYKAGHLRLPVVLNGRKKAWMILDSGASTNIFHAGAVESLNLPVVGSLPAVGIAGYEQAALVETDSIQIGELTLYNQVAGKMDMAPIFRMAAEDTSFGGFLGYDFLSRFPLLIDYQNSTITVFNPESFAPPAGGAQIDFYLTLQIPTAHGEINGVGGDFLVDLGNALGLVLHRRFVVENQLEENLDDIRINPGGFGGVGGVITSRNAFAASFRLGDVLISSLRVLLPDSAQGVAGSQEVAGNIGNLVWENFRLLLDYRNRRLILYDTELDREN